MHGISWPAVELVDSEERIRLWNLLDSIFFIYLTDRPEFRLLKSTLLISQINQCTPYFTFYQ